MMPDLRMALLTSNDCTCTRWEDSDGDERLPRDVRETNLDCPDHGLNAARVLPPLDDIVNEAWEPYDTPRTVLTVDDVQAMKADLLDSLATTLSTQTYLDPVEYLRGVADGLRTGRNAL